MTGWVSTHEGAHLSGRRKVDTEPELRLRRALRERGVGYRLHVRIAAGCTPDLLMRGRKVAVFVDGCYWHSCPVHGRQRPFTGPNALLWEEKMQRNRARDARATELAAAAGYRVVRLWECEVRDDVGSCVAGILGL